MERGIETTSSVSDLMRFVSFASFHQSDQQNCMFLKTDWLPLGVIRGTRAIPILEGSGKQEVFKGGLLLLDQIRESYRPPQSHTFFRNGLAVFPQHLQLWKASRAPERGNRVVLDD
jgi:hypothetical protein